MDDIIAGLKCVGTVVVVALLAPPICFLWSRYIDWLDKKFNRKWWS